MGVISKLTIMAAVTVNILWSSLEHPSPDKNWKTPTRKIYCVPGFKCSKSLSILYAVHGFTPTVAANSMGRSEGIFMS